MNNREKIREHAARAILKLAEPLKGNSFTTKELADQAVDIVASEFLAALDAVLGAEPSEGMIRVAIERGAAGEYNEGIWKAMADVLRSELKL